MHGAQFAHANRSTQPTQPTQPTSRVGRAGPARPGKLAMIWHSRASRSRGTMCRVTRRSLPRPVPATWLRVYEPLEAFPRGEREYWAAYAAHAGAGGLADEVEQSLSWRRLLAAGQTVDAVALAEQGGDLAALIGDLPALSTGRPGGGGAALPGPAEGIVSTGGEVGAPSGRPPEAPRPQDAHRPPEGEAARAPQARVLRRDGVPLLCPVPPNARGLVEAWQVPVAWVALARHEDLMEASEPGRYVIPMSRCRARAARTLKTLRNGLGEGTLTNEVAETGRWLESFHPRSCVELDSRSVVELVGDDGAEDVRMGLEGLADGDAPTVAAAYRRIHRRAELLREIARSS